MKPDNGNPINSRKRGAPNYKLAYPMKPLWRYDVSYASATSSLVTKELGELCGPTSQQRAVPFRADVLGMAAAGNPKP